MNLMDLWCGDERWMKLAQDHGIRGNELSESAPIQFIMIHVTKLAPSRPQQNSTMLKHPQIPHHFSGVVCFA